MQGLIQHDHERWGFHDNQLKTASAATVRGPLQKQFESCFADSFHKHLHVCASVLGTAIAVPPLALGVATVA